MHRRSPAAASSPAAAAACLPLARPFLKWAGGKVRLLRQITPYLPERFDRYIEPFVGGGAMFFHLWNTGRLSGPACLFDSNEELVNAYRIVRDRLEDLIEVLAGHQAGHNPAYYYQVRNLDRDGTSLEPVDGAARTIYLNKTCYNGLYRVNSRGQFNVPLGRYHAPRILNEPALRAASAALQGVSVEQRDFESIVGLAGPGDFFYFDPPYDPATRTANFTSYTRGSFGRDDQRRLAKVFRLLAARGCCCLLSNSSTPFIRDLYRDFRVEIVRARRAINSDTHGRGLVDEVLVMANIGAEREAGCC